MRKNWFEIWNSCSNLVAFATIETNPTKEEINLIAHNQKYFLKKTKMQNPPFKFHQNLFKSSNFAFVHFSHVSFEFIQLRPPSISFKFKKKIWEISFNH